MEHGHRRWFTLSTASISHAPGATAGQSKGTTLVRVIERPFHLCHPISGMIALRELGLTNRLFFFPSNFARHFFNNLLPHI